MGYTKSDKSKDRNKQTLRLLKWVEQHQGFWYLICTPDDEHMNPQMMKTLIGHLAEESFYEIIFVLLTVHRNEKYMEGFYPSMLLKMLVSEWDEEHREDFIKMIMYHFE